VDRKIVLSFSIVRSLNVARNVCKRKYFFFIYLYLFGIFLYIHFCTSFFLYLVSLQMCKNVKMYVYMEGSFHI